MVSNFEIMEMVNSLEFLYGNWVKWEAVRLSEHTNLLLVLILGCEEQRLVFTLLVGCSHEGI